MNIYILYTGGTIGCVGNPLSPLDGVSFVKAFQSIVEPIIITQIPGCQLTYDYFATTLDSTNMQPGGWVTMAESILKNYSSYDGFVILHGTDTMAWTSSALSFMLPSITKPVIVTGAQLPLFHEVSAGSYLLNYDTDALRNVLGAIMFATMAINEVCLFFEDHLLRGNRAMKSNANQFTAFTSPNYPALGLFSPTPRLNNSALLPLPPPAKVIDNNLTQMMANIAAIGRRLSQFSAISFLVFPAYYDISGNSVLATMLSSVISGTNPKVKGLVIESYGDGNVPDFPQMRTLIEQIHTSGVVIVDCTQVDAGQVDYDVYATGAWLSDAGVVSAHDMIPPAALAKLIYLLGSGYSQQQVEEGLRTNLAGEMMSMSTLSAPLNQFLMPGSSLISTNGRFVFTNDKAGNLILVERSHSESTIVWSKSLGQLGRLVMQQDCNLVFYNHSNQSLFASDTAQIGQNAYFVVTNDGKLAIYNYYSDELIATLN